LYNCFFLTMVLTLVSSIVYHLVVSVQTTRFLLLWHP